MCVAEGTLFLFATMAEAMPFIGEIEAGQSAEDSRLYEFDGGGVVVSGLGMVRAAAATALYAPRYQRVVNAGIAGALGADTELGTIMEIGCVGRYLHFPEGTDQGSRSWMANENQPIFFGDAESRLVSVDFPLHNGVVRDELSMEWELVDMEGYGVALAAQQVGKPFRLVKCVSDFCSTGGHALIKENIARLSKELAEYLLVGVHA
jgi:nucleoside phosphorylase